MFCVVNTKCNTPRRHTLSLQTYTKSSIHTKESTFIHDLHSVHKYKKASLVKNISILRETTATWYFNSNGSMHRVTGPAFIRTYRGFCSLVEWYYWGKLYYEYNFQ